jgi:hypothetical protein
VLRVRARDISSWRRARNDEPELGSAARTPFRRQKDTSRGSDLGEMHETRARNTNLGHGLTPTGRRTLASPWKPPANGGRESVAVQARIFKDRSCLIVMTEARLHRKRNRRGGGSSRRLFVSSLSLAEARRPREDDISAMHEASTGRIFLKKCTLSLSFYTDYYSYVKIFRKDELSQ